MKIKEYCMKWYKVNQKISLFRNDSMSGYTAFI